MTHSVRATIEPAVVRKVDDGELVDLARQRLIHSYEHTPEAAVVLAAHGLEKIEVAQWKAAAKGDDIVDTSRANESDDNGVPLSIYTKEG